MQWLEQQGAVEEIIALYKDILNYYWKKNTAVDGVEEDAGAKKKILKENQQTKKSYNSKKSPRLLLLEVIGLPQRSAIN